MIVRTAGSKARAYSERALNKIGCGLSHAWSMQEKPVCSSCHAIHAARSWSTPVLLIKKSFCEAIVVL